MDGFIHLLLSSLVPRTVPLDWAPSEIVVNDGKLVPPGDAPRKVYGAETSSIIKRLESLSGTYCVWSIRQHSRPVLDKWYMYYELLNLLNT
jgi:hypothetical protein